MAVAWSGKSRGELLEGPLTILMMMSNDVDCGRAPGFTDHSADVGTAEAAT